MSVRIYLSYHPPADRQWTRTLAERLYADGYAVSGDPAKRDAAEVMLVVASPQSVQSAQIQGDMAKFQGKVIPVIPPTVPYGSINWMPFELSSLQFVDFSEDELEAYVTLRKTLGAAQPRQTHREHIRTLIRNMEGKAPDTRLEKAPSRLMKWLRRESSEPKESLPAAYIEILDSSRRRDIGCKLPISRRIVILGSGKKAHLRIRGRGVAEHQCNILYNHRTETFYLEIPELDNLPDDVLTTLHDRIVKPGTALPLQNGDILMLSAAVVVQFRRGEIQSK